ncbi:YbhB/YbcL family Raf kinase inhibitor-like protein [Thermosipho atlanticus]|uniref:Phospholipid-binding protein, PBP family n=1 Tax=Thermosipho atlanticus DSM 15807 TaxID=1123380 RepID=A0A1M5T3R1_9BACT|nr:YbhB/YbcL family Raf kinase inhibitor-like protein [Thermosipho atlanticus]SHH45387.1 phospholipid-binding protein, PBP family [Thermosipho atlanticus DSM 15807]
MIKISTEFDNNDFIPKKYTCDGENINPKIIIQDIPKKAKTLVIICDDSDAPFKTFVHWIIWNIPVKDSYIIVKEGLPKINVLPNNAKQGLNDFGKLGYYGPCPSKHNEIHHYFFKVYAINTKLELDGKITKNILEKAFKNFVVDEGKIVGLYKRT